MNIVCNIYGTFLIFVHIQFSILAERLALERQEIQVRKKAQEKVSSGAVKTSHLSIKYSEHGEFSNIR